MTDDDNCYDALCRIEELLGRLVVALVPGKPKPEEPAKGEVWEAKKHYDCDLYLLERNRKMVANCIAKDTAEHIARVMNAAQRPREPRASQLYSPFTHEPVAADYHPKHLDHLSPIAKALVLATEEEKDRGWYPCAESFELIAQAIVNAFARELTGSEIDELVSLSPMGADRHVSMRMLVEKIDEIRGIGRKAVGT